MNPFTIGGSSSHWAVRKQHNDCFIRVLPRLLNLNGCHNVVCLCMLDGTLVS